MELQADISAARLRRKIGQTVEVLVDAIEDGQVIARSSADAPEIDGLVYIADDEELAVGEFAQVEVIETDEHDLYAVRVT
jgi:ribosomal protein S12 methylthiotransferase